MRLFNLQVIPGISFCGTHILPHIAPKSQHHINDNGRAHRKDGSVHEILADPTGGDPHPVPNG